jgi:beta-barrel assembly-enhancing protease
MNRIKEMEKAYGVAIGTTILVGPTIANVIAAKILTDLYGNAYSREVETSADLSGSDICAAAGYNPYGMIWLMQDFIEANPNQVPQVLADHPSHETRIQALQSHFRENPNAFSRFSADRKLAKPFSVPEDAPVVFLRH